MRIRSVSCGHIAPRSRLLIPAVCALLALLALGLAQTLTAPTVAAQGATPTHPAHALPTRTDPAANAILSAPPSHVVIWFSEALNPLGSRIVVVDPSNHEVDARDSHISSSDPTMMTVGLQLLRPGAYVAVWRAQAVDDGHVTGGSFLFRIANADGSVPPVPATLPSGNVPGAAGFGSASQVVDAPTLLQAFGDWLALLCALFWVGGLIWEVWALPATQAPNALVALGARLGARRFHRLAPYALVGALLANILVALALTVEVAGSWRGAILPQFWQATIFSGSFGAYWWMRQVALAAALVIALIALRRARQDTRSLTADISGSLRLGEVGAADDTQIAPSWTRAALDVVRQTPRLPMRLARGWLGAPWPRRLEVLLGALLLYAFAMSGHAAATPPSERVYAVSVDLAHLIFSAMWLGGLLYISLVLIPAARALPERARALLLARGAPEYGAIAIVSAAALALTGSLNAGVRLTSLAQFATTIYGRVLFVKIELFLIMVAISAYHAFWLRPRLTRALAQSAQSRLAILHAVAGVSAATTSHGEAQQAVERMLLDDANVTLPRIAAVTPAHAAQNGHSTHDNGFDNSAETTGLRRHMEDWLRREALLGVGVLLCVALLALFAGTLTPAQASAPVASAGVFSQRHTISGYAITLRVDPAKFGQNTFTVTVTDVQGKPITGASALLLTNDLDMDMGQQSVQAQAVGAAQPGVYRAQSELTMAGNWSVTVKVLPPGAKAFITTTYKLVAGS
jgi:putative copper export protein/methionine-rich copper-binding protein CopC